ncbi:MAG: PilZ domain-containing protein [Planctomycetota bacterium]|nr:PilZ domain-containing protein [Planctomycetota bacterium]
MADIPRAINLPPVATRSDAMDLNAEPTERRISPRIKLSPMHSPVTVQNTQDFSLTHLEGHAYDISETGVRLELDEAVKVGSSLSLLLELPGQATGMFVAGEVVWINDEEDDPGPRRMALRFTDFPSEGDRTRLQIFLGCLPDQIAA